MNEVYGYMDSHDKVEVIPKATVEEDYYNKNEIDLMINNIVKKSKTISVESNKSATDYIEYPTGYSQNNSMIISSNISLSGDQYYDNEGSQMEEYISFSIKYDSGTEKIKIWVKNESLMNKNVTVNVLFMKIN